MLRRHYAVGGKEPAFVNPQDAGARGIRNGDIARAFSTREQVLAGAVVSGLYSLGVTRIHGDVWYDPDSGGEIGVLCKYGSPNVLTLDIGASQLTQTTNVRTTSVETEKYIGKADNVTMFSGLIRTVARCEYVPVEKVMS